MHFKTLVTVDVPELEPNPLVDEYIEKKINLIKEDLERAKKKNYIEDINLDRLNALRTDKRTRLRSRVLIEKQCIEKN